ncbi:MAG: hypothetical protein A3F84_02305 [Candidatus Handelsmanbacteria bacterium RIFCSPLOWO2_12_FULL_64_10]|uniref:D,D-heptose 1,7-bisphosphate phosphatase n=1 Tax=Handelsmanbacteria sp. (strain RIFCSPLOWO2_12_FULL_64_10) TaxID=1817868 RepID=A0A1F6CL80_HANXR|nr:MAG: hypothetical protein A3F84_02305 [Candidatus Handelsmanbacteria bacterium RIFCSPLOWO2_12_FULL_64_10]
MKRAVFLDRDGTINLKKHTYITEPDQFDLIPGVAEAIGALREAGYLAVLATNQSAVARGLVTPEGLDAIHERMNELLGAPLDALYACLHYRDGSVAEFAVPCECRKPLPGMLLRAAREHGIDLRASVFVGDAVRDLRAGRAAGTRTVLVRTGSGEEALRWATPDLYDRVAGDLSDAGRWILGR